MRRALVLVLLMGAMSLAGQAAHAQGIAFGLGAGVVKIQDVDDSKLWATGNLRLKLGERFALEPEVGWYGDSEGSVSLDVINFGGNALFLFPVDPIEVFLGGGGGGHMFRVSSGAGSDSETKAGLQLLAGADLQATDSLRVFGAIRWEMIQAEVENVKQWKFYLGIRLGG
jgi:opacity protein-like surface antigen